MLAFLLLMIGLPGALAWGAGKLLPNKSRVLSLIIIVLAAAVPSLWFFWATQQADSITRAASFMVSPYLFVFALIPAGIGFAYSSPSDSR